ncbi:MAG: response regulator, partial [Kiritimatiellae bacterium]|nr:response regulator [Kiritimatiellia bacterium]
VVGDVNGFYTREMEGMGVKRNRSRKDYEERYLYEKLNEVQSDLRKNTTFQLLLISLSLAIMFNIYSTMREREQQADKERTRAEEQSKAKTTFLSNMSHDIRTPMNAILGYIELAKRTRAQCDDCEVCPAGHCDKAVPEKTEEFLEKIDASSKHLLALINDILEMSRIESGKMELEIAPGDICQTLDEARDLFATQMEGKNIEFVVDTSGVEHRFVHFDTNRLNRVLLNLLSNAFKFTPKGGKISVTLTESEPSETEALYELRVRDSGIGMSKEFADTVFESFTRERTSTVSGIQGTGLGMAITKNIVDMMGGSIKVETEPGKGTEFIIDLRLRRAPELAEKEAKKEAARQEEIFSGNGNAFAGKKLLLVDDLDVNREIAKMLLMGAGFEVDTATNGKEAVDTVAASQPGEYSAVLMDIQMPVMNGYEATKAIRELPPELACVPILAMTASAFSEDVMKAKSEGMDGHIAKPIDIPQMMQTLAEIVQK